MKRYSLHDPYFESELRECADGYLVDYEDVEKLQQQNEDLLTALKELRDWYSREVGLPSVNANRAIAAAEGGTT